MKKVLKITGLFAAAMLIFTGCHQNEDYKEEPVVVPKTITVSTSKDNVLQETETYEFDENGNKTKYIWASGESSSTETYKNEYDEDGNLTKVSLYYNSNEEPAEYTVYEYDDAGNNIYNCTTSSSGYSSSYKQYKYNSKGKMISYLTDYNYYEYEYDSSGFMTKKSNYTMSDGKTLSSYTTYKKGSNDKEVDYTCYNSADFKTGYGTEIYENNGYMETYNPYHVNRRDYNCVRIIYGVDVELDFSEWTSGETISYKVDSDGNFSEVTDTLADGTVYVYNISYTYY